MQSERRAKAIAELEADLATGAATVDRLAALVRDPEQVIDRLGRLPADRREYSLIAYSQERERSVKTLREEIPQMEAVVKAAERADRSRRRYELDAARRKLERLLAVPPLTADDMCSECATPWREHGWSAPPYEGPCPAWPGWAARLQKVREMLLDGLERKRRTEEAPAATPKPEPLATIPSGLPITEVMDRLGQLQREHPNAVVKRGSANRWELWPGKPEATM